MKILILFKKWSGGVGTVVKSVGRELEKKGHKIKIVSREDDLKIYSLVKSILPIRKKVKELMKEGHYDIIYSQDWSLATPLLFPFPLYKKKHFCCFHGNEIGGSKGLQNLVGKIMEKKLIVVGDSLKQRFPKSSLIYNRVDSSIFKPNKKIKKIKNSVGFASWKTKEYHYNEIKKVVEEIGKKLIIAENIPKEKMQYFYRKLESFISLPPPNAGFGLVYLEAMASGVPKIIGNNWGGGNLLPITKIENYKGDIKKTILNAEEKDYRKWLIDNNFTWEDASCKIIKIFEKRIKLNEK